MCGFGMDLIFKVAIFVIVVLVVLALLRAAFGEWFNTATIPYWGYIQIVLGGVIAILILLFIWRLAECAGLFGRYSLALMGSA
jgi:hypothetical protein